MITALLLHVVHRAWEFAIRDVLCIYMYTVMYLCWKFYAQSATQCSKEAGSGAKNQEQKQAGSGAGAITESRSS